MEILKGKVWRSLKSILPYATVLLAPLPVFAQITAPISTVQQLLNLMCNVFGWMFYGLIVLSLIMIIIAAFNYTTAGGEAEKVSKANKMILYAAIGIAVALLAKGIPLIVANFISTGINGSSLSKC
jgi:hypothetical protein